MRVVLVDDDEDVRFTTELALKSGGYRTDSFSEYESAIEALQSADWTPVLFLLDLHLDSGIMDTPTFIQWLRDNKFPDVPVMLVSGTADAARIARSIGAAGHLVKPFGVEALLKEVAALVKPT